MPIKTYDKNNRNILRVNFEREHINLEPDYQRSGEIWNNEKRQLLIDSILNDYDIPKIYFNVFDNKKNKKSKKHEFEVIDGRQRLETIWKFIDGLFPLADDFVYQKDPKVKAGGMTYLEIAKNYPDLKGLFDSFDLPIICVEADNQDLIEDMFLRLNEAVPLNAAEKRNAMGGAGVKAINSISVHKFFKIKIKPNNKRYQHKEIACRLLYLVKSIDEDGKIYDTKKIFLDSLVLQLREKKDGKNIATNLEKKVNIVLEKMFKSFEDKDVLLTSQSSIPIYFLLFFLAEKKIPSDIRKKLNAFKKDVIDNRKKAELDIRKANYEMLEYDRMSVQGTNDASSIIQRLSILSSYLKIKIKKLDS